MSALSPYATYAERYDARVERMRVWTAAALRAHVERGLSDVEAAKRAVETARVMDAQWRATFRE